MQLTPGNNLTQSQKEEVLRAFNGRFTGDHRPTWAINYTRMDGSPYEPTYPTDTDWLNDHAFYIRKDGHLAKRPGWCEPAYLAKSDPS